MAATRAHWLKSRVHVVWLAEKYETPWPVLRPRESLLAFPLFMQYTFARATHSA